MKKLLIFLVLVGYTSLSYSQNLIQTFTDRCTGATQVFQISMTGPTVVVFYNRSQTFTAADVQSGAFQAWLEETYTWWASLNPCSAAQAESTTAQQTAQQTTSAATAAATNAASAAPPPPPPPDTSTTATTNTGSTNTSTNATSNTSDTTSNTGTDTGSSSQSSDTSSTGSSESSQGETGDTGGGGESTEDTGGGESSESKSESTEESKSEESSETESEEKVEEESSEESSEEESSEEESDSEEESEEEESSEDSEDSDDEDEEEEKKKNLAPPILAANVMSMQMLDGTWSTAASFGISQSSLTGQETYSANAMIWSNFKQFSLALSKSKVHFWADKQVYSEVKNSLNQNIATQGRKEKQGIIHHVGSTSLNYMNIFGTSVVTAGYSHVILGQEDNFWKGFAGGYAAMGSLIVLPESLLLSPSLTFFGTKPVAFKALPRWGFAPMVAVSLSPIQLNNQDSNINVVWNKYFNYIIGTNANFNLTQRFVANIGLNTINNTNPIIPTTLAVTIGARFAF